jgi:hypothetical protein
MGIPLPLAHFFCGECKYKAFPKRILLLGRQTILFDDATLRALAAKWNFSLDGIEIERDMRTVGARNSPDTYMVSDTTFFRMLGVETVDAIDHSDFEGANIIHDMGEPVPSALWGQYDLIFNGSVLDNMYDVAAAHLNIGRLLAPGGRVIHIETATANQFSYSALSPSWFFDYATVNGYADCKVYMGSTRNWEGLKYGPWAMLGFDPSVDERPNAFTPDLGAELGVLVVVAEKGEASTTDVRPIQSYYRSDADWQSFCRNAQKIAASDRPLYFGLQGTGEPIASFRGVWRSCGHWGL